MINSLWQGECAKGIVKKQVDGQLQRLLCFARAGARVGVCVCVCHAIFFRVTKVTTFHLNQSKRLHDHYILEYSKIEYSTLPCRPDDPLFFTIKSCDCQVITGICSIFTVHLKFIMISFHNKISSKIHTTFNKILNS